MVVHHAGHDHAHGEEVDTIVYPVTHGDQFAPVAHISQIKLTLRLVTDDHHHDI